MSGSVQHDAPAGTASVGTPEEGPPRTDDEGRGRPRTVLIFAHECAPYHRVESTVGAQRPAHFAKHLPAFGWRAIVICRDARRNGSAWSSGLADDVRRRLREADPHQSVIIPTSSLPYDGVLDRTWRALLPRDDVDRPLRALLRKPLTAAKLLTGDHSQSWQPCARAAAEIIARETSVDACLAEHSPDAGLFLARWFASEHDVPWVADFRDPILQPHQGVMRRMYRPIARRLLRTAASTINVTPVWAESDAELTGRPSVLIPNGYEQGEWEELGTSGTGGFDIVFTGNVWKEMRPDLFFAGLALFAAALTPEERAAVRFVYRGGAHARFRELARAAGVAELVDVAPAVPRTGALRLMRNASLLLLLSIDPSATADPYLKQGIYPGKTFEYFGARRPILCVPGDRGVLHALIGRTRTGVVADTPERVAQRLHEAHAQWRETGTVHFSPDEEELRRYSRRATTAMLAGVLDAAVVRRGASAGGGRGIG